MNIYDISERAGVSIATVSRVINGNTKVSDKTRAKVLAIIEECGYTPNAFARGLGLDSMNTIGILCTDSSDPYLASAIYHLEQMLRENGYDAILCCSGYELEGKRKYLNLLLSKRVDGVILVGSNFIEAEDKDNEYIRIAAKKVPVMLLNGVLNGANVYSALCDDFHAVYEATTAFINADAKNILYLYNANSFSGKNKLRGYYEAHMESSRPINESLVQYYPGTFQGVRFFLEGLRAKGIEFDAIITSDDSLAVGALKYAKHNHLSVPDQLSIIGYNNSVIAEYCNPELSSIDNKLETVCRNLITSLMGVFSGQSVPLKTVFSAEIIKRETTKF